MATPTRVYVNGAFVPRYVLAGQVRASEMWRVGNVLLTDGALELGSAREKLSIPIASVVAVEAPPPTMRPPAVEFDQCIAVRHREGAADSVTLVAFPRVTVRNFPLQLAAVLMGDIRAFLSLGGAGQYEEVALRFRNDRFAVGRKVGSFELPLEQITSVEPTRRKDAQGRDFIEAALSYVTGPDAPLGRLTLLTYDRLPFAWSLFSALRGMRRGGNVARDLAVRDKLDETTEQVTVLLYTGGMGGATIAQALGVDHDRIDEIYEHLVKQGLAKVVKVRKEVALTPDGIKLVDEIMKRQIEAATQ